MASALVWHMRKKKKENKKKKTSIYDETHNKTVVPRKQGVKATPECQFKHMYAECIKKKKRKKKPINRWSRQKAKPSQAEPSQVVDHGE